MINQRRQIARYLIVLMLLIPISSMASVLVSSDHSGHCLDQASQQVEQSINALVQQLCTMDECIDVCESLFHCSSHSISITSSEIGLLPVKPDSLLFQDISTSHLSLLEYGLFRPPRH